MSDIPRRDRPVALSLSSDERWTLHHVLLDRIEQESTAADPTGVEPPPVEVFRAFERLDAGGAGFTLAQLEAMQALLAEYRDSAAWGETEGARFEQLLQCITDRLEKHHPAITAD